MLRSSTRRKSATISATLRQFTPQPICRRIDIVTLKHLTAAPIWWAMHELGKLIEDTSLNYSNWKEAGNLLLVEYPTRGVFCLLSESQNNVLCDFYKCDCESVKISLVESHILPINVYSCEYSFIWFQSSAYNFDYLQWLRFCDRIYVYQVFLKCFIIMYCSTNLQVRNKLFSIAWFLSDDWTSCLVMRRINAINYLTIIRK